MRKRLLLMAAGLVSCLSAQRPEACISPVFARHGIHVVTAGSAEGRAEIASLLGPDAMAAMAETGSHVALLRNNGPHRAGNPTWTWTGITQAGQRIPQGHNGFGCVRGIEPGDFCIGATSPLLSEILMDRARQPGSKPIGMATAVAQVRGMLSRYVTVEASLDSVLLSNGTVIGPDKNGYFEGYLAHDAALSALAAKLNDPSLSDADLDAWLAATAEQPPVLKPNGHPDQSRNVIGGTARMVRLQIQLHGRAKMSTFFAEVTKANATKKQLVAVKE